MPVKLKDWRSSQNQAQHLKGDLWGCYPEYPTVDLQQNDKPQGPCEMVLSLVLLAQLERLPHLSFLCQHQVPTLLTTCPKSEDTLIFFFFSPSPVSQRISTQLKEMVIVQPFILVYISRIRLIHIYIHIITRNFTITALANLSRNGTYNKGVSSFFPSFLSITLLTFYIVMCYKCVSSQLFQGHMFQYLLSVKFQDNQQNEAVFAG